MEQVNVFGHPLVETPRKGGSWASRMKEFSVTVNGVHVRITQARSGRWRGQVATGANVLDAGMATTTEAAGKAIEGLISTWSAGLAAIAKAVSACLLVVLIGCSTSVAESRPADPYFARGVELGRANNEAGCAIEWARLKNPVGEHAAMTVEERAAAISSLWAGWKQGRTVPAEPGKE